MIITDMTNADYHAHAAIGSSLAKTVLDSPRLYLDRKQGLDRMQTTAAMETGTLIHRLLLEPDSYDATVNHGPINERTQRPYGTDTQAFAAWQAENPRTLIVPEWVDVLRSRIPAQVQSLLDQPGLNEASVFADLNGIKCKCRPDRWLDNGTILDLKTISSIDRIDSQFWKLRYWFQMVWYESVAAKSDRKVSPGCGAFLFVETKAPYRWRIVDMDWEYYEMAKAEVNRALTLIAAADAAGDWQDTSDDLYVTASPPAWATDTDETDAEGDDA